MYANVLSGNNFLIKLQTTRKPHQNKAVLYWSSGLAIHMYNVQKDLLVVMLTVVN